MVRQNVRSGNISVGGPLYGHRRRRQEDRLLWGGIYETAPLLGVLTCATICDTIAIRPSVNIRQLRDTRRLKAWLRAGKTVELRERDKVIARIVPETADQPPAQWPDFAARAREILGDRVLNSVDDFLKNRHRDWES